MHGEEREKLVGTEINKKTKYTCYNAHVNLHEYCSSLKILDDYA